MITGMPAWAAQTAALTLAVIPPLPNLDLSPKVISPWCFSLIYVWINFELGSVGGPLYRPSTSLNKTSRSALSSRANRPAKLSLSQKIPVESCLESLQLKVIYIILQSHHGAYPANWDMACLVFVITKPIKSN